MNAELENIKFMLSSNNVRNINTSQSIIVVKK